MNNAHDECHEAFQSLAQNVKEMQNMADDIAKRGNKPGQLYYKMIERWGIKPEDVRIHPGASEVVLAYYVVIGKLTIKRAEDIIGSYINGC